MKVIEPIYVKREINFIEIEGLKLALHSWNIEHAKAAIFYFHGLQSHAGWLWETGCKFAENGIAFYVLDRRGCGISEGQRNEVPLPEVSLNDYILALKFVREKIGQGIPLGLFGHCLGGSFLAALLSYRNFNIPYEASIFCSSWLGKLNHTLSEKELTALLNEDSTAHWDVGLKTQDFTDSLKYRKYIDNDVLATRQLTRRSRTSLLLLENMYIGRNDLNLNNIPTIYISGSTDPIIDLNLSRKQFNQLFSGQGDIIELPAEKHYLLFTDVRNRLINIVSAFIVSYGYLQYAAA